MARSVAVSRWLVASSKISTSGPPQQGPGDGQPLPLAAGEVGPALADDRLVPLGQAAMNSSSPAARAASTTSAGVAPGRPRAMFSRDRAVEDERVLGHQADPGPQRGQVEVAQVHAVDQDLALGGGVEAHAAASAASTCPTRSRRRRPPSCPPGCAGPAPPGRWRGSRSGSRPRAARWPRGRRRTSPAWGRRAARPPGP